MIFLPEETFLQAAKNLISAAKDNIAIATFKLELSHKPRGRKLTELFALIAEKAAQGVKVRLLTNQRESKTHIPNSNSYAIKLLKKSNIYVRQPRNNRVCHAKVLLVDEKRAIIGSHNLSVKSISSNLEVSILITDEQAAGAIAAYFDHNWHRAGPL